MNHPQSMCFCQNALECAYQVKQGDICRNCVRELSLNANKYSCLSTNCIYRRISNQPYYICEKCHNGDKAMDKGNEALDRIQFICNKISSSLDTIS